MKTNSLQDLKDKVCILTGGCGVFGGIFSVALINVGAKVAILDYKKGRCEECTAGIAKLSGSQVLCVVANVLDKKSLIEAKKQINSKFGKVDILINGISTILHTGQSIIIPAHTLYTVRADKRFKMISTSIGGDNTKKYI